MSPDITQINARQPASHRRRFKVSTVRFVDYHGTRVGFAAEVVAAQECAPSRFAPLSENVADNTIFQLTWIAYTLQEPLFSPQQSYQQSIPHLPPPRTGARPQTQTRPP